MAANLDKSENSLTTVSTLTYLRGIDASGNSVKISTSDLASVLGVFLGKDGALNGDLSQWLETNFPRGKASGIYVNTITRDTSGTYNNYSVLVTIVLRNYGLQLSVNTDLRVRKIYQNDPDPFVGATWHVIS